MLYIRTRRRRSHDCSCSTYDLPPREYGRNGSGGRRVTAPKTERTSGRLTGERGASTVPSSCSRGEGGNQGEPRRARACQGNQPSQRRSDAPLRPGLGRPQKSRAVPTWPQRRTDRTWRQAAHGGTFAARRQQGPRRLRDLPLGREGGCSRDCPIGAYQRSSRPSTMIGARSSQSF